MIRRSSADLVGGQRAAQGLVEPLRRPRPARRSRASATSTVRLPSVRSSPAGFPVDLRVAVHPEQVVAELERLAERQPEPGQRRQHRGVGAGERGADVQRPLDGVLRGLVAQHPHRLLDVGGAAGLHRDVEELPGDHLAAGGVEERQRVADHGVRHAAACAAARRTRTAAGRRAGSRRRRRTAAGRRSSRSRGAAPRRPCGSPAGRAGCPRRPCSRRAPARSRAAPRARQPHAPGPRRRGRRRARHGSPRRRRPPGTACRRDTAARAASTSRAASWPERRRAAAPARRRTRRARTGRRRGRRARPRGRCEVTVRAYGRRRAAWTAPGPAPGRTYAVAHGASTTSSTGPAERASVSDLIAAGERSISFEFFPPKDEAGRAAALDRAARARGAAADLRLGDVRRRGLDPRPHGARSPRASPRDHADADGAPDLRRALPRRAAVGDRVLRRRRGAQRARAARRPARRPGHAVGADTRRARLRQRAGRAGHLPRRLLRRRRGVPRGAPGGRERRGRRAGDEGQAGRRRRFAITELFFRVDGLLRAARALRRGRRRHPDPARASCRSPSLTQILRMAELSGRRGAGRGRGPGRAASTATRPPCAPRGSRSPPRCATSCSPAGPPGCTSTR